MATSATLTIQISRELQEELIKKKIFDKETYEEVIWDLIEDSQEINEETKKEMEESRKEIAEGKFITFDELMKELKL